MHLSVGTRKDNMQDAARKGRVTTRKGEECHFSKLTKDSVIAIRADGRSISEIAEDYNICNYNVSQIKRKETWKHV